MFESGHVPVLSTSCAFHRCDKPRHGAQPGRPSTVSSRSRVVMTLRHPRSHDPRPRRQRAEGPRPPGDHGADAGGFLAVVPPARGPQRPPCGGRHRFSPASAAGGPPAKAGPRLRVLRGTDRFLEMARAAQRTSITGEIPSERATRPSCCRVECDSQTARPAGSAKRGDNSPLPGQSEGPSDVRLLPGLVVTTTIRRTEAREER